MRHSVVAAVVAALTASTTMRCAVALRPSLVRAVPARVAAPSSFLHWTGPSTRTASGGPAPRSTPRTLIRSTAQEVHGEDVRVRFAPSPTGTLHVGGARTALFNWLKARHEGGKFVIRIEDTDTARSTRESEESMVKDLQWLGLDWDEGPDVGGDYGPYRQSERGHIYQEKAKELMEAGLAYPCFCTQEELDKKKEEAEARNENPKYDGMWRDADPALVKEKMDAGEPYTIRFKVPSGARVEIDDIVRGKVGWDAEATVGDFIILRSSGIPVYNFCVAVDDATMKISHVIRAEEHLTNTLRQGLILEALGYRMPEYAHCSLILGEDRSKLSKRHGATSVDQFRKEGFLRDAMINYLAGLGWNDGTDQEIYEEGEIIEAFSLDRVVKSSAVFDMTKLKWINGQHIRIQDNAALQPMIANILEESGICASPTPELTEAAVAVSVQSMELLTDSEGIVKRCLSYPLEETIGSGEADKLMGDDFLVLAKELVEMYDAGKMPLFEGGGAENSDAFNGAWSDFVKELGKGLGRKGKRLFHPVRLAVTGSMSGPDVAAQMRLLGHAHAAGEGAVADVTPLTARMDTLRAFVEAFYVPPDPNAPPIEDVEEVEEFLTKGKKGKKAKKGAEADEDEGAVALKEGEVPTVCEFAKMDVRVGELTEVWNHPESNKLYCEKIDVGDAAGPREVCSGLAPYFTLEEMKNQRVLVVCNLKPAKMAGFVSNGMVLCAKSEDGSRVEFMEPPEGVAVGTRVLPEIMDGGIEPLGANQVKKKKVWEGIAPDLTNSDASEAMWAGRRLVADGKPCKAKSITGGTIG